MSTKPNASRKFTPEEIGRGYSGAYRAYCSALEFCESENGDMYEQISLFAKFITNKDDPYPGDDAEWVDLWKWLTTRQFAWDTATSVSNGDKPKEAIFEAFKNVVTNAQSVPVIEGDRVTHSSALGFLSRGDCVKQAFNQAAAPYFPKMVVKEYVKIVGDYLKFIKMLPDNSLMGEFSEISEASFHAWKSAFNAEYTDVGPYLAQKYLLQVGSKFEYFHDDNLEEPYLLLERNGVKAFSTDKYSLGITGNYTSEQKANEMAVLLRGIKVGTKQVRVVKVPVEAYYVVTMFMYRHDIKMEKSTLTITARAVPQKYGEPVEKAIDQIAAALRKEDTKPGTKADEIIDWVARCVNSRHTDAMKLISDKYKSNLKATSADIAEFVDVCEEKAAESREDKYAYLASSMITPSVTNALTSLSNDRKLRNRDGARQTSQYIQKNVGSVYAPGMMPMFDTHCKLRNVIKELVKLIPKEWTKYHVDVYGVAYNHMGTAIEAFDKRDKVTYYDNEVSKNSNTPLEKADVFDLIARAQTVILDDTYIKSVPAAYKEEYPSIHDGSLLKLRIILKKKPAIIATKLSMSAFVHTDAICKLIFGAGYKVAYIAKFGKLHNQEVFLVLSKYGAKTRGSPGALLGDINCCAVTMQVANFLIMKADARGVTLDSTPHMWRKALKISPMTWPWYNEVLSSKNKCYGGEGGQGAIQDMNMEVEYDDFDFDGEVGIDDDEGDARYEGGVVGNLAGVASEKMLKDYVIAVAGEQTDLVRDGQFLKTIKEGEVLGDVSDRFGTVTVYGPRIDADDIASYARLTATDETMHGLLADLYFSQVHTSAQSKSVKWSKNKV